MTAQRGTPASDRSTPPFVVLMPLWGRDVPDRVELAISSATVDQHLRPDLLLLTVDGPLPAALEGLVARVVDGEFGPAEVLRHDAHRGVAAALQDGLEASPYELVARADADDICRPERFALQIPRMRGDAGGLAPLDLLGGSMREFNDRIAPGDGPLRSRPLEHDQIVEYLPHHSPFHHPTVVMRRSVALAVGGYRVLPLLEDYWLWERMMLGGARMGNIEEVVVDYRVDEDLFARRGGWRLYSSDLRLQRRFVIDRVTTPCQFLQNLVLRGVYRFIPGQLRRIGYRKFIESSA
ncbi:MULTISPECIES: glycosyltransferase [unclassified Brachybacterium]|uniref:glycosyltransferase n=1 Tax=unclassified Brachybacterium TaxID=2623841 RepID=UPI00403316F1